MKNYLSVLLFLFLFQSLSAQVIEKAILNQSIKAAKDLKNFVAIPNDALNHEDIMKNIEWLDREFSKRGFKTELLETSNEPLFFAELPKMANAKTLLFYMHLDGQAVDPSKWNQDSPYEVVLKAENDAGEWEAMDWSNIEGFNPDWRMFGRSAADDKGPIVMFLHAMDMLMNSDAVIRWNIKVLLDSEEEKGSRPLAAAVKQYKDKLKADFLMIHDGPMHLSGQPTMIFGCRGITRVDLTVFGPSKPQHSGHYGNYAPNPVFRISKLLSSMKDEFGRVVVKGYYDGIELDEETKKILAAVPDDEEAIFKKLGIAEAEKVGMNYQESLQYPSLNVRGIEAAWVGDKARTIVPDQATAAIDIRLVPESDPKKLIQALKDHIREQGYYLTTAPPTAEERSIYPKICQLNSGGASLPFRTDMSEDFANWLDKLMTATHNRPPVKVRIMGGTVPISPFINELQIPAIILPMVNADNNQHSPNENLKLAQIPYGIRTFLSILVNRF
ncbi:MAG: M20/M25/M40 family metallo-hydrolase [Bacteroidia bacterium]|nr:M20/M25/M40 family metallo-hydrolase [Bacteroidia bacterium]